MINPHALLLKFVTKHINVFQTLIVIGFVLGILDIIGVFILFFLLIIGVI